jgi:GntR family transcriptional regulator
VVTVDHLHVPAKRPGILALKRHSALPLYVQIRNDIVARIESGEFEPGARLPSEFDLSRRYRVGRPTVRQAVDLLRREGVAVTIRGSGTFVSHDTKRVSLLTFDGLTHSLRARGMEPVDVTLGTSTAPMPTLEMLSVPESEDGWWIVSRLRSLKEGRGSTPFCVETDAFSLTCCPAAEAVFTATNSATAVLEESYGYAIARCDVASRAARAGETGAAGALGVSAGTPLLVMERVNWSVSGELMHVVRFVIDTARVPIIERLVNQTLP